MKTLIRIMKESPITTESFLIKKYNINEDIADKLRQITFKNPETNRSNTMLTALANSENPYHNKAQRLAATYKLSTHKAGKSTEVNHNDIDKKGINKIMGVFKANDPDKNNISSLLKEKDPAKFTQNFKKVVNPKTPDEDIKTIYSLWNGDEATVDRIVKKYNFGNPADLAKRLEKKAEMNLMTSEVPIDTNEYKPDRSYKETNEPGETISDFDYSGSEGFDDGSEFDDDGSSNFTARDFSYKDSDTEDDNVWGMIKNDTAKNGDKTQWGRIIAIGLSCLLLGGLFKSISNIFGKEKEKEY